MDLKARSRSYQQDGVTLWLIPYSVPLSQRVAQLVQTAVPLEQSYFALNVYMLAAPLTVQVDLPAENPPEWAVIIKDFIADKSYFLDPVTRGFELLQVAPEGLFNIWHKAYQATRQTELMASADLQNPSPSPRNEDGSENPTTNSTGES